MGAGLIIIPTIFFQDSVQASFIDDEHVNPNILPVLYGLMWSSGKEMCIQSVLAPMEYPCQEESERQAKLVGRQQVPTAIPHKGQDKSLSRSFFVPFWQTEPLIARWVRS